MSKNKRKIYKLSLTVVLALCAVLTFISTTHAADFQVISVIRTLPLKNDEAILKDYYINAGTNNGLTSGATLDAMRKLPVYDNTNNKVISDTLVPVAKLKIIYVDKAMAVARLVRVLDKQKTPIMSVDDVIIGDKIKVAESQ